MKLDTASFIPYYHQIKREILSQIESGKLKENEKIPSETKLAEHFKVSRQTVRKALDELVYSGYLWRKQGSGTFVLPMKIKDNLSTYKPFVEKVKAIGKSPQIKTLSKNIVRANKEIADLLNVSEGEELIELIGLRLINNQPINLTSTYYPVNLAPSLDEFVENKPIFEIVEKHLKDKFGLYQVRATQNFQVVLANIVEAEYLKVETGFPLILWEGVLYLNNDCPFQFSRTFYRSDKYQFQIEQRLDDSLIIKENELTIFK